MNQATSYSRLVWKRLWAVGSARRSIQFLFFLIFIALTGDFIANEKPLYCRVEGRSYFPVFQQYLVDLGATNWAPPLANANWRELPYEKVVFAPIPYSGSTLDLANSGYVSPFARQEVPSWRFRHWLGTDKIGRDVLAGMIAGVRTALLVGLVSMGIASLIGIFLGAISGYFGDGGVRLSWTRLILYLIAAYLGLFYGFILSDMTELARGFGISALFLAAAAGLAWIAERLPFFRRGFTVPVDFLIQRLVEVVSSIPSLLLILAVAALIRKPSILYIMVIIGLVRWTGISRFVRAEILRIRNMEYISAARAMGFSAWRILFRHALPNALAPVLISIAFGIAGAILSEATLSFLGIGVAPGEVTWGSLLSAARSNASAWWLAVFPGMAIFTAVLIFNLIGDGLTDAMDARRTDF